MHDDGPARGDVAVDGQIPGTTQPAGEGLRAELARGVRPRQDTQRAIAGP